MREERVKKEKGRVGIMNGNGWIDEMNERKGQKERKGEDRRIEKARMCFRGCVVCECGCGSRCCTKGQRHRKLERQSVLSLYLLLLKGV